MPRPAPQIVAIVNLTSDSFSGDGLFRSPEKALEHVAAVAQSGADVIDIGAESTRPGATPLTAGEEWRRLEPFLAQIAAYDAPPCPLSLDTRHAETAEKALKTGIISWINDVSSASDPAMPEVVARYGCRYVMTHSLSVPANPALTLPEGEDPVRHLVNWSNKMIYRCVKAGIAKENLILDPGIGFGKTTEQSITILKHINTLKAIGLPVLIGHSRKSFLKQFAPEAEAAGRDPETLALSLWLAEQKVDYMRVHNVKEHRRMLNVYCHFLS